MSVQSDRQFFQRVGSRGIGPTLGDGTARGGLLAPTAYNVTAFVSPSGVSGGGSLQVVGLGGNFAWVWVKRDAAQSMASVGAAISWDTEETFPEPQGDVFYSSLPTDTLTVPFDAMVTVEFAFGWSTFSGATDVQLEVDGTAVDMDGSYVRPAASGATWQQESMTLPLAQGTALRLLVVQTSGSAQDLLRATLRVTAMQQATQMSDSGPPPGMLGWWKADAVGGTADGATVTTWPDQSGNGHDLPVRTGAPTLDVDGFPGGGPAVVYDGNDAHGPAATWPSTVQPYTILLVGKVDTLGTTAHDFVSGNTQASKAIVQADPSSNRWRIGDDTTKLAGTSALDAGAHLVVGIFDGSSSVVRVDRVDEATGNAGTASGANVNLGAGETGGGLSSFVVGRIAEVLWYGRRLTATEMEQAEDYLARWGV